LRKWIETLLSIDLKVDDLSVSLRDGKVLCMLINKISPDSVKKIPSTTSQIFKMSQNVQTFLDACQKYGVQNLFLPSDLVRKANIEAVLVTLEDLAALAEKSGLTISLEKTKAPRNEDGGEEDPMDQFEKKTN